MKKRELRAALEASQAEVQELHARLKDEYGIRDRLAKENGAQDGELFHVFVARVVQERDQFKQERDQLDAEVVEAQGWCQRLVRSALPPPSQSVAEENAALKQELFMARQQAALSAKNSVATIKDMEDRHKKLQELLASRPSVNLNEAMAPLEQIDEALVKLRNLLKSV